MRAAASAGLSWFVRLRELPGRERVSMNREGKPGMKFIITPKGHDVFCQCEECEKERNG